MTINLGNVHEGDTVTIEDDNGNRLTGVVSCLGEKNAKALHFDDTILPLRHYLVVDHKPKPKPWDEAPIGSLARVGISQDLAIKRSDNTWEWYGSQREVLTYTLQAGFILLVEKKD